MLSTGSAAAAAGSTLDLSVPPSTAHGGSGEAGVAPEGTPTFDAAAFEFTVTIPSYTPAGAALVLRYAWGSGEYASTQPHPDAAAMFIWAEGQASSRVNVARLPDGAPVGVGSVGPGRVPGFTQASSTVHTAVAGFTQVGGDEPATVAGCAATGQGWRCAMRLPREAAGVGCRAAMVFGCPGMRA